MRRPRQSSASNAAGFSIRAGGLSELASVLALPEVTPSERAWLADLLVLDAHASAIERQLVADLVAHGKLDEATERLGELDRLRSDRRARLRSNEPARARFSADPAMRTASLDGLQQAAAASRIPVLLYWTTSTNVIAWYVGADGSDVRAVFLPTRVLEQKVDSVLASSRTPSNQFDETAARELFLYLLGPFAERLNSDAVSQIMIVPHGPLVRLPFESLIDPAGSASVIDRWAVSYAPNATMALQALQQDKRPVKSVVALVDQNIDDVTKETEAIKASGARLDRMTRSTLFAGSWKADGLHILTHGNFDPTEALLSSLAATGASDASARILAAELPALPLRGLQLAVLSACQGGRIGERISGELYGFPWALLAGGVASTVLSRWDINGASNGQWMAVFYKELAGGASTAMAAAVAMREMRKQGTTHPYYWAAMQVSGRRNCRHDQERRRCSVWLVGRCLCVRLSGAAGTLPRAGHGSGLCLHRSGLRFRGLSLRPGAVVLAAGDGARAAGALRCRPPSRQARAKAALCRGSAGRGLARQRNRFGLCRNPRRQRPASRPVVKLDRRRGTGAQQLRDGDPADDHGRGRGDCAVAQRALHAAQRSRRARSGACIDRRAAARPAADAARRVQCRSQRAAARSCAGRPDRDRAADMAGRSRRI